MNIPGKYEHNDYMPTKFYDRIIDFINPVGACADIGCKNPKMEYIKNKLNIRVHQINAYDFNDCNLSGYKFDTIFFFEVIEHIQNPLHLMTQVKTMLKEGGTIYLSSPARPQFLWTEYHFHEMKPERLQKWIFEPCGLVVKRKEKLKVPYPFWKFFPGIRPIFRLFFTHTWIYELQNKNI